MTIETFITDYFNDFSKSEKSHTKWKYEDGCILSACMSLYEATKNSYYKDLIKDYMDHYITDEGSILTYEKETYNLDNIQSGKALFFLLEETKEDKYKKALDDLMDQLKSHPRTGSKSFWHKQIYPDQIWLDGLYMAQPFYLMYEKKFNNKENYADIINQYKNCRKFLFDEDKKLYYHAYDEAKIQKWANKTTGWSPNFWIRAMGWYFMSIIDTWEAMGEENEDYKDFLKDLLQEAVDGILPYKDAKTNMFYQLVDRTDISANYLETSGSSMIACSILKACRLNVLPEAYLKEGLAIFNGIVEHKLLPLSDQYVLTGICEVAGLGPGEKRDGTVAYYLSESIVSNEVKGVAAFSMAYAQSLMVNN
ncbi:MAG: glycoside hydrolase family 105 protein [Anaerocolumna sp.]